MKIYISGPMRGLPQTNFPAFDAVAEYIRSIGWEPISPADNDRREWPGIEQAPGFAEGAHMDSAPPNFTFEKLFVWDVKSLGEADAVVLLPNWHSSVGARLEVEIAKAFNKPLYYAVITDGRCTGIQKHDPARPEIIGVCGYAQVGKDTVAGILVQDFGFTRLAFADVLREILFQQNPLIYDGRRLLRLQELVCEYGWEGAKKWPEVRRLLQVLGTEAGRNVLGENIWIDHVLEQMQPGGKYVISDVRFPNEAWAIWNANGELWRVIRPGYGPVNNHPSEVALDHLAVDRRIYNNSSLNALSYKVHDAVQARTFGRAPHNCLSGSYHET